MIKLPIQATDTLAEDAATTDGMPPASTTTATQPTPVSHETEAEAVQFKEELDVAKIVIAHEQQEVSGLMDMARALLMYVDTPEERVLRDRRDHSPEPTIPGA